MAEMISSMVAQETISQVLSGLIQNYVRKGESNTKRNLERLEMAHIKLEAALETSYKWQVTDASLLRWRKKLKCATQECDDTLHKCKQRILEAEQIEREVSNSSLPNRIAHASKSFVFSAFNRNNELSGSIVQRFEWFADGASEFLRFIELGGTPRYLMPFSPLIRNLLIGKKLQHKIIRANESPLFLLWMPFVTADHGMEAALIFMRKGSNAPEDDFFLCVMLQLSESVDIVGIAIKCLQLFAPLFKSTIESVAKELMQLPTQDLLWVPNVDSDQKKHLYNLHSFGTQWFRPNPLCCKQGDQLRPDSMRHMSELPDVSLEPIIEVNLQCRVSLSKGTISPQDPQQVKAGLIFMPHGSSEDLMPESASTAATQMINGVEQQLLTNITLQQLEEIMLPKAIDYFLLNTEVSVYQMLWKSKHGTAYFQAVKNTSIVKNRRRTVRRGTRKGKLHRKNLGLESETDVILDFFESMAAHAPVRLQGMIEDWIRKEKEKRLTPPPLCLQF